MNLSEEYQIMRLDETQDAIFQHLLPAIVALVIFCFVGIIGNIVTVIFYAPRSGRSSTFIMITSLAVVDLVVCVAMILSIWELATLVTAYNSVICKLTHFFGRWSVGSSCFVLWIITIDRHRKICKPFKTQVTLLKAKQFVVGFVILALLLSVKELVHYSSIKIPLKAIHNNESIHGYYCRELEGPGYIFSITVFNAIDMLLFVIIWVSQIVVYVLIIYNLVQIRNNTEKIKGITFSKQTTNTNQSNEYDNLTFDGKEREQVNNEARRNNDNISYDKTSGINLDDCPLSTGQYTRDSLSLTERPSYSSQAGTLDKELSRPATNSGENEKSSIEKAPKHKDCITDRTLPNTSKRQGHMKRASLSQIEIKLTLMLFSVSLIFVLCFTPYFVLVMWAFSSGKEFELEPGIKFAIRLPFLNSVFNPIVYFAFNAEFRSFVKNLIQRPFLF